MSHIGVAFKSLVRRPLHTGAAILVLALGLSSAVAVLTYGNGFRRPFPGADTDALVRVFDAGDEDPYGDLSYPDYGDVAVGSTDVFEGLAAVRAGYAATIRHEESTEVVFLEAVSGNAFDVLGVAMSAGRRLTADDDRPGAEAVAVISHAWWQRQWNGDPSVIGSIVNFNYRPHVVVGVAAPEFRGSLASFRPDAWLPFEPFQARYTSFAQAAELRDVPLVRVYGRLRPDATGTRVRQRLASLARGLDEASPRAADRPRHLTSAPATWIDPRARDAEAGTVRMMMVAAAGLLLLVGANVGNLLLAVAAGRRREMALKAALGASRGTLVGQVLLESLVLATTAGAIALLLAAPLATRLGSYFARPSVWGENVARSMTVDLRVVGAAIVAAVSIALVSGLVPALAAGRRDLVETLKTGSADADGVPRRLGGRRLPGARDLLVTAQVGLAVVLLVVAGLTLRTLSHVGRLETGLDHEHMVASYISTSSTAVTEGERLEWFRALTERLSEEPWVRRATISQQAPLSSHPARALSVEGMGEPVQIEVAPVVPGFFETVGMRMVEGRDLAWTDTLGAPDVAVVSEAFVRRWLREGTALGRMVHQAASPGSPERRYEIVGVVSDARIEDYLTPPPPVVYLPNPQQTYASGASLTVATTIDPALAAPRLARWLRDYEKHIAIVNIIPYTEVVRGFTYVQRMNAQMFSVLAALGLVLSVVGVFAVMTLAVGRRTREIGVRMAVGARSSDIGKLVVRRALAPVALGVALGAGGSLLLTRWVRSLLFEVEPADPVILTGAALLFVATALIAVALPARRAVSVSPTRALRAD